MDNIQIATTLFYLIAAHALVDFSLQNEFIAVYKNRHEHRNSDKSTIWPYLLSAHALQHGLAVFIVTQKLSLGLAETAVHWITDFGKSEGWYGFHTDQFIHVVTKIVWLLLLVSGMQLF